MASDANTGSARYFGRRSWMARAVGSGSPRTNLRNEAKVTAFLLQAEGGQTHLRLGYFRGA